MEHSPTIDLWFPITGKEVPVDHGYQLYAAISRCLESPDHQWLHESNDIGIHLVRGSYAGPGRLTLGPHACFGVRLSAETVSRFLPFSGNLIQIGDDSVRIGIPKPSALIPAPNLYAHLVTTKNGQDEARFDDEVARQLATLNIQGKPQRGPRRIFRIKEKRVVAHTLLVTELTAEESIRLQESGLGGRRKLGCGVFVPHEIKN